MEIESEEDIEDLALVRAIEESLDSATVSRDDVFKILEGNCPPVESFK